jgi:hypothetical protein
VTLNILGGVSLLTEPIRSWTGAPRSPQRTWAENDTFRLLLADRFAKSYGGLRQADENSFARGAIRYIARKGAAARWGKTPNPA